MKNYNPFDGQWQCSSCNRWYGKFFTKCIYCKDGVAPPAPVPVSKQRRRTGTPRKQKV